VESPIQDIFHVSLWAAVRVLSLVGPVSPAHACFIYFPLSRLAGRRGVAQLKQRLKITNFYRTLRFSELYVGFFTHINS